MDNNVSANSRTQLLDNPRVIVERSNKFVLAKLIVPHKVLSTSDINGGEQDGLTYLANFQSMESNDHSARFEQIMSMSDAQYHAAVANELKVAPDNLAVMGTAANMNNMVHINQSFREIDIDVLATAGIKANAMRAGDRANWYEGDQGNEFVKDHGTINVMVLLNRSLSAGAMAKAAMLITEAKSAALTELATSSAYSSHIATGTGTDQYILASPLESPLTMLKSASGHLKLGELISRSVKQAVLEAIALQSDTAPSDTRSLFHALGRFGLDQKYFEEHVLAKLSEQDAALLRNNLSSVISDSKVVAFAYAYAAILDRVQYGTISGSIERDILLDQASNIGTAISGQSSVWNNIRNKIDAVGDDPLAVVADAIALGWEHKWQPLK